MAAGRRAGKAARLARLDRALPERLDAVLHVIYLVFNEGYSASSGASVTTRQQRYATFSDWTKANLGLADFLAQCTEDEIPERLRTSCKSLKAACGFHPGVDTDSDPAVAPDGVRAEPEADTNAAY